MFWLSTKIKGKRGGRVTHGPCLDAADKTGWNTSGCFSLPASFSRKQGHYFESFWMWTQPKGYILCFNVEYNHGSSFPFAMGLYLQYLAENTRCCVREAVNHSSRTGPWLKNPQIKGLSCLPDLGRSNPSIVPLNLITPKHIHRDMQLSSAHFTQTNQSHSIFFHLKKSLNVHLISQPEHQSVNR